MRRMVFTMRLISYQSFVHHMMYARAYKRYIMNNQKLENLLNLSLDATENEREKSEILDVGYDPLEKEWELIVKYSGETEAIRPLVEEMTVLLNEYMIVTVRESVIDQLSALPQVEYVEKPKRLYFQIENGKRVSCIDEVQDARFGLSGNGVLLGIIDSGIDYTLDAFRKRDGSTRILYLWDQTNGNEYISEEINKALAAKTIEERNNIVQSNDSSGHGTAVAGIAASAAPESDLIVVKMGLPRQEGFPRTTELMRGVDYVIRKSIELRMPVALNISFGNSYGAHNGQSLVERYLDSVAGMGRCCICAGAGNEGRGSGHASGSLIAGEEKNIELAVQQNETGLNVQIWKNYTDEMSIMIVNPSGIQVGPLQEILGPQRFRLGQTELLLYYGKPSPYSTRQEIFMDFLPVGTYITPGIWQIILIGNRIVDGRYDLWLPGSSVLNDGTGFTRPSAQVTVTIPATAGRVITVGAYDARTFTYADFSGRGALDENAFWETVKPDLAAPGVAVRSVAAGGGYGEYTGTSFAVPFVTGSAALLMEWGIIQGNDPYLYGEKVKAYLRRGARELPGFTEYPNNQVGYGALCTKQSIPEI